MSQERVIEIADKFIATQWRKWRISPERLGVKPPLEKSKEWTVLYKTVLPGGRPDEVVDGPTVVLVDLEAESARFLPSM